MDGYTLLRDLRAILQEDTSSAFLEDRVSYEFLYQAACEFVHRTGCSTTTQSITTVSGTSAYELNPDFLYPAYKDKDNKEYIKINDGTNSYWIYQGQYEEIIADNNTTSQTIPDRWAVIDNAAETQITGWATANGTATNGECTLTDTNALVYLTDVTAGDLIHNLTDGSHGYVISVTSSTALITALFDGAGNDWATNDSYIISSQNRSKLILDPPPSVSGYTVTVYYVQRPTIVASPYRQYRIPAKYRNTLVKYAAWLYKYRDRDIAKGDVFQNWFDLECRKAAAEYNRAYNRRGFTVSLEKR